MRGSGKRLAPVSQTFRDSRYYFLSLVSRCPDSTPGHPKLPSNTTISTPVARAFRNAHCRGINLPFTRVCAIRLSVVPDRWDKTQVSAPGPGVLATPQGSVEGLTDFQKWKKPGGHHVWSTTPALALQHGPQASA